MRMNSVVDSNCVSNSYGLVEELLPDSFRRVRGGYQSRDEHGSFFSTVLIAAAHQGMSDLTQAKTSSPVSVLVLEPNASVSTPSRCSIETNKLQRGVF